MTKKAINTRVAEEKHARLMQQIGDDFEHATQWVRDQIDEEIREAPESEDTGHYPIDKKSNELYKSLLEHGRLNDVIRLEIIAGAVSQDTKIAKKDLPMQLRYLRKHGFVTMYGSIQPDAPQYLRVKPPAARPDKWTRREVGYSHEPGYSPPKDDPLAGDPSDQPVRTDTDDLEKVADGELKKLASAKPEVPADD